MAKYMSYIDSIILKKIGKQLILMHLLCFFSVVLSAQSPSANKGEDAYQLGLEAVKKVDFPKAVEKFLIAQSAFRQAEQWEPFVKTCNSLADVYLLTSQYAELNEVLGKALPVAESKLPKDSPLLADIFDKLGIYSQKKESDYKKSLSYYEKALAIRIKKGEQTEAVAKSYNHLADYWGDLEDYEKFKMYANKALTVGKASMGDQAGLLATTYSMLGTYYFNIRQYDTCQIYHTTAMEIAEKAFGPTHPQVAVSYNGLSSFYSVIKNTDRQREYLEKAISILQRVLGKGNTSVAESYMKVGRLYYDSGDYENAKSYYLKGFGIFLSIYGEEHPDVARCYNSIAQCYNKKKNYDLEYENLRQALDIQLRVLPATHTDIAATYTNLGFYYQNQSDSVTAIEYLNKALEIYRREGEESPAVSNIYNNIAKVYMTMPGNQSMALEYFQKSLDIKLKKMQPSDPRLSLNYINIANFYLKSGNPYKSLQYVQKSLNCIVVGFKEDNVYKNPVLGKNSSWMHFFLAMQEKGEAFKLLYKQKKNVKDLEMSLQTYQLTLDVIDSLRLSIEANQSRQEQTERSMFAFEGCIEVAKMLFDKTGEQKYLEQAFAVAERSKSFLLLQALKDAEAKGFGGIPDSLQKKESDIKANISFYENLLNQARKAKDAEKERVYDEKIFDYNKQYKELVKYLEKSFPKYYNLKYSNKQIDINEVRDVVLDNKTLLIEYFWGDSTIYCFVMDKKRLDVFSFPVEEDLTYKFDEFRRSLSNYNIIVNDAAVSYKEYVEFAWPLYQMVLEPALKGRDGFERLLIVPDNKLGIIPFEAFLTEKPKGELPNFSDLPYLVRKYTVNYGYSSTLTLQNMQKKRKTRHNKVLAFAPSYDESAGGNEAISDMKALKETSKALPGAQQEVKIVATYFDGTPYFGESANEGNFKKIFSEKNDYNILHLAMHGFANKNNANYSFLAFQENMKDTLNDDVLYAYELNNMNLDADLVVLSACETGYGTNVRGEGIMSMARGFIYAGTPSVVMSLWKVNDYATSKLMTFFYEGLSKGMAKDEALQYAKLQYMETANRGACHPAFWAGFVSIGNPEPLDETNWWLWGGGGAVLAIGAGAYFRRRKKQA